MLHAAESPQHADIDNSDVLPQLSSGQEVFI